MDEKSRQRMSMRNISVIVEYFPPRLGADRRTFEIMKRLSRKYRTDFIVVPPSYVLFIRKIDSNPPREREVISENMVGHGIGLPHWIWKSWQRGFLIPLGITIFYVFFKVFKKIIDHKPHFVMVNTSVYTGLIGLACSKILRKPLVVDFDDLYSHYTAELVKNKVPKTFHSLIKWLLIVMEDRIIKNGWKVLTLSKFLQKYAFQRKVREDTILIPDGVDTSLFDPSKINSQKIRNTLKIAKEVKLCVYAGRIDENIGGDILLEVVHLLKNDKRIMFLIIGEGDPLLIQKLGSLKNVILPGLVPKEQVPEYLAAADIILVPFPNKPASHAASPLKIFEGLAMQKPVIASKVSGIKDVIKNDSNGLLVSDDPNEWVSTIKELVENPDKALFLGENGRKTVTEEFDWDTLTKKFENMLSTPQLYCSVSGKKTVFTRS